MNSTRTGSLLGHQWRSYPRFHRSRLNLLIHVVAVPIFLAANVLFVVALVRSEWLVAIVAVAAMGASMFAQGRGHHLEATSPEPFTGPLNAITRIFAEQWIAFPRFVFTGRWLNLLRRGPVANRDTHQRAAGVSIPRQSRGL